MSYQILNTQSVIDYILTVPALANFFSAEVDSLTVREIGDGNLNLVFVVSSKTTPSRALIVKQAVPYLRCAGEGFPLAKERMHYEISALEKFGALTPQHTPSIYHADQNMCLVAMQYLGDHIIMRKGMIAAIRYPKAADHLSTFLAESLFKTSSLYLESTEKSHLISYFNQNELRKLTENFVFSFPFMPHETNKVRPSLQKAAKSLWSDQAFKLGVLSLKDLFMNKTDALLHADLHTGSIMINADETYIIDPEFSFDGPFGFDLGALIANLIMSWISHLERPGGTDYRDWILNTIRHFISQFEKKFLHLWNQHSNSPLLNAGFLTPEEFRAYQQKFMLNLLQESIGFAGCKIARRQLGIAGVEDIRDIADIDAATRAETMALNLAREFVVNYRHYNKIDDIIASLHKHLPAYHDTTL